MYRIGRFTRTDDRFISTYAEGAIVLSVMPTRLVGVTTYLLCGDYENDFVRLVLDPNGGPPEIKQLRVTMTQILAKIKERVLRSREQKISLRTKATRVSGLGSIASSIDDDELEDADVSSDQISSVSDGYNSDRNGDGEDDLSPV